ncbi:hypothetical protein DOQ08_01082 [Marinobacter litoralis]|uniref:Exonuclease n=1 Tax=Marinobacter litoralis TaxID=187981 RepID=A0A3M2RNH5_9GAMM|nr:hypothetical protein [Marinobacter litoralis]RMJ06395.1 hypothetical protein DOQ08_01082 [Marinobacter litoralis]
MYILDIQASGTGAESYPAEIAWCRMDGSESYSTLINPDSVDGWKAWSHHAARYGLTRQECCERGDTVAYVARRVGDLLKDYPVYSESPIQDQQWLDKLFMSAGKRCPAKLVSIEHAVPSPRRLELHRYLMARRDEHNAAANSLLLARAIRQIKGTATPRSRNQSALSSPFKWLKGFSFVT